MGDTLNAVKVSVVIPVYNAAKTLAECLDSILNQTMPQFEVVCVDDGSKDNSWELLQAYASRDSRIRAVQQENQGPGMARNHGIRMAKGDYIIFVDADDYILPHALETICDIGYAENADIVLYDGDKYDATTGQRIPVRHFLRTDLLPENGETFSVQDSPDTIFQVTCPGPVTRAYRRTMVQERNLGFSKMKNSEDLRFTYTAMASAQRIAYTTQKLYMYRVGQTTNVESGKASAPLCFIEAYLELAHWLQDNGLFDLCRKSFGNRFCSSIVYAIETIHDEAARRAIVERLQAKDVKQLRLLDQSDAYYGSSREVRQVRWLLENAERPPVSHPKVSVIIPVYNVEKYLPECLESLMRQTLEEFEVLCIDDGSTDRSTSILTLYSRLDARINVICGTHQGAAASRNQGIEAAVGEYLYFMDSDDKAVDTLLEKAYTAAVRARADVVAFDIQTLDMQTGKVERPLYCFRKYNAPKDKSVFSVVDAPDRIFQISNPSPWTKMVRREFVMKKNLRYQSLQNTNDAFFAHMSMALAQRITLLDEQLYIYRVGMTGNIQSKKEKHPECAVDAYLAIYNRLVEERIWTLCEKSWLAEFLSIICFTLKTVSSRAAYRKLYLRLCQPDLLATGYLDHEREFYPDPYHYELVKKFLASPIKYAQPEDRNVKCLVKAACDEPMVSVIIPAYNVEGYLTACLESVQNQTLQNIEIICVDDGSSDGSLGMLCKAAEADSRISVLTQNNSGQSAARNAGIAAAQGKYLYYMDSDDLLEPNTLQFLVNAAEANDLDCVFFGGKTFYESEDLSVEHNGYDDYYHYRTACGEVLRGSDLMTRLVSNREYRASPCMQMVRAERIRENAVTFYEGIPHEDELYTLEIFLRCERCMVIPEQFYLRRIRDDSTVTAGASVGRLVGYLTCYTESLSLVNQFALTGPQYEAVYVIQDALIYQIRKFYGAITGEERLWVPAFCTGAQRSVYHTLVKLFTQQNAAGGSGGSAGSAAQNKRLNDHDTALRNAQKRMDDHDIALGYLQQEIEIIHRSIFWKLDRLLTWLPRRIKRFLKRKS